MRMGRSHLINRCKLHEIIKGFFQKYLLKNSFRKIFHVQIDLNSTSRSTSILRPIRSQFYVQFDLNSTSNSTSILHPIRPQFHVQFDLSFTSNSTSILRSIWPQFYVQIETNGTRFFCRRYEAEGDMKLPLATIPLTHGTHGVLETPCRQGQCRQGLSPCLLSPVAYG